MAKLWQATVAVVLAEEGGATPRKFFFISRLLLEVGGGRIYLTGAVQTCQQKYQHNGYRVLDAGRQAVILHRIRLLVRP